MMSLAFTIIGMSTLEMKMSKKVIIELEFDHDNVSDADVYDYLDELMDNHILDWQFLVKPDNQRT
jgi:hypothetical protein